MIKKQACRNNFWTSSKPFNNTHLITGSNIQPIDFDEFTNSEYKLIKMTRMPVASFETLKLEASTTDYHLCICVLYEVRKVQNISQRVFGEFLRFFLQRKYLDSLKWAGHSSYYHIINCFIYRNYYFNYEIVCKIQ